MTSTVLDECYSAWKACRHLLCVYTWRNWIGCVTDLEDWMTGVGLPWASKAVHWSYAPATKISIKIQNRSRDRIHNLDHLPVNAFHTMVGPDFPDGRRDLREFLHVLSELLFGHRRLVVTVLQIRQECVSYHPWSCVSSTEDTYPTSDGSRGISKYSWVEHLQLIALLIEFTALLAIESM